ncbi:MAG: YeeE/YedE thiosulfate transporter family protein [Rhodobacterales bacterium]|nr:YeeE/YedE thiosulfate transporter family protein [Rhodobacterales bacterium]
MILNWKTGGLLLGVVFFMAVFLVKPIGVSTQFVILDGIIGDVVNSELVTQTEDGYASTNAYLDKSNGKYAKAVSNPLNYSFVFVLAMMAGAFISAMLRGGVDASERSVSALWRANFGDSVWKRHAAAFAGGFIVLYGARLAGGCTSGHMMSGMMQSSLSGYMFTAGAFLAAIPVAMMMYKKEA